MRIRVEICWVFILQSSESAASSVCYCSDDLLDNFLSTNEGDIIYYRRFDNVIDAVAHKRYLDYVSGVSFRKIISTMNPRGINLRPIIEQMIN